MNNWFDRFCEWQRWELMISAGVGYPETDIRDFRYEIPFSSRIDGLLLPR